IVPHEGTPRLEVLCAELAPDATAIRRLQRQMDRQRRANTPDNYDERGRIKKRGKQRLRWKESKRSSFNPAAQSHARAQTRRASPGTAWPPLSRNHRAGQAHHHGKAALACLSRNSEVASGGLRAPGMFIERRRRALRLVWAAPRGARPHASYQTLAVL